MADLDQLFALERALSRRKFLAGVGLTALGGALAACTGGLVVGGSPSPGTASQGSGTGGKVDLDFVVWTYAVETVKDNVDKWMASNPDATVRLSDYGWDTYHDTMVQRLSTTTATDVLYNNGSWLAEFASAGWVVPIEDVIDFEKYRSQLVPYALSGVTYENKAYGLPYYCDIASFIWNPTVAKQYGVDRAPATWDELAEMAGTMQAKGLAKPILWEFSATDPSSLDEFIAMTMSRGGEVFDANMDPIFEDPSSPGFQHAQFMADTITKGLAATSPAELDAVKAMNTGQHVFTVMYNYNLAAMNNKGVSPLAGQFALALMPGSSHETLGYVRMYGLTTMAQERGKDVMTAAGQFIESMGGAPNGEFTIAKRWAVERGLGFGVLPCSRTRTSRRRSGPGWTSRCFAISRSSPARSVKRNGRASGARRCSSSCRRRLPAKSPSLTR